MIKFLFRFRFVKFSRETNADKQGSFSAEQPEKNAVGRFRMSNADKHA